MALLEPARQKNPALQTPVHAAAVCAVVEPYRPAAQSWHEAARNCAVSVLYLPAAQGVCVVVSVAQKCPAGQASGVSWYLTPEATLLESELK